jgi:transcription termination factor NusB
MARDVPWDAQTDSFISDLNAALSKKYNVNFRAMLMNPGAYAGKKDVQASVDKLRGDVDRYFAQLLDGLKDEQEKLNAELEKTTAQYKQVDSMISNKSSVLRIPYVRPLLVNRNPDSEETIVIDEYDSDLDAFIGKLVSVSSYVANISAAYKQYYLGSWIFSGATKNYVLTMNPPLSPVLAVENGSAIINGILDSISRRPAQ